MLKMTLKVTQKRNQRRENTPTGLIATRVPLCHVLVRFFPKMLIPILSSSSFMLGFGWVSA